MKRLILILITFPLLLISPTVYAENDKQPEVTVLAKDEVIDRDYFAFNESVEILGTVNGDVYSAAGTVLVKGKINGDLIVAGGKVDISGEVTQDVRAAGGQVQISGKIGKNLSVAGGQVTISESAQVTGSLLAGAGDISIYGSIGSHAKLGSGNIILASKINGDLEAITDRLRVSGEAEITGNLNYWSRNNASIDSSALIGGETKKHEMEKDKTEEDVRNIATGASIAFKIISTFTLLVLGLLLIKLTPVFSASVVKTIKENPWKSVGVGFVSLFVLGLAIPVLFITILGAPLSLMLLLVLILMFVASRVIAVLFIGSLLRERLGKGLGDNWTFVLGLLVYEILLIIPIIGFITGVFATLFGLGSLLIVKKEMYSNFRKKGLI